MGTAQADIPIDPQLLIESTASHQHEASQILTNPVSPYTDNGTFLTRDEYASKLFAQKLKAPLQQACQRLGLKAPKSANLELLRLTLVNHWFPAAALPSTLGAAFSLSAPATTSPANPSSGVLELPPPPKSYVQHGLHELNDLRDFDEVELTREFGVEGADELLGFEDDALEEAQEEEEGLPPEERGQESRNEDSEEPYDRLIEASSRWHNDEDFERYRAQVRTAAVERAELDRRAGGLRTQEAVVKEWNRFASIAKAQGDIKDEIVDEHSLLLFIKYNAERLKRDRKGVVIPGTQIGPSHLKKLYYGALRIRKQQEAENAKLAIDRPAKSVIVWDAIKNRMHEAGRKALDGLLPGEDAPDIVANTILEDVTPEQFASIGDGFLQHRNVRLSVFGHLAWTSQNATGNRGDDLRALRLCELQPYIMTHLNKETKMQCISNNPSMTVLSAHREAEQCPMGALALYLHFVHDVLNIEALMGIEWKRNSSWRKIRVLFANKSPNTPLSDQSLYNLYVNSYRKAGFESRIKVHLPRHLLGFRQEAEGVDPMDTAKLGWKRGETYHDTYRPPIAKSAVLGAHGYRDHEIYDPLWRHVTVPERFLASICPMAESRLAALDGEKNLIGAANHWRMVILLRPYLFQCAAVIFKRAPNSAIFRLPAFASPDVCNWMATTFFEELTRLQAKAGEPADLSRIQDAVLRQSIEGINERLRKYETTNERLMMMNEHLLRCTEPLSPSKGYSNEVYYQRAQEANVPVNLPSTPKRICQPLAPQPDVAPGVYLAADSSPRAYITSSPTTPGAARQVTEVDLVLPPAAAFCDQGAVRLLYPPLLGRKSVRWPDVFSLVKQPQLLWDVWKPSKTLDQYSSVQELWDCYNIGEPTFHDGVQTGVKPPLRLVEQQFKYTWRNGGDDSRKKQWERFREIPEWIDAQATARNVTSTTIINELEELRGEEQVRKGLNWLMKEVKGLRKAIAQDTSRQSSMDPSTSSEQLSATHGGESAGAGELSKKRKRAAAVGARVRAKKVA